MKVKENNDFIADGLPPEITYKELTLNLEYQGYEVGAWVSESILYPITLWLIKKNLI